MFVQNHMTRNPQTIVPEASAVTACDLLRKGQFHQLPVVDASGRLHGIVTDRDVRSALGYEAQSHADLRVEEIMTSDPICTQEDATIEDALIVFCERSFGALPVMHGQQLVGILTRADLLRAFYELLGLDMPGTRIEVAIPEGVEDIVQVMRGLTEEDQLTSVVAGRLRTDGQEPVLYMRTSSSAPWQVEKKLRAHGAILLAPEQSPA